jgi:hypothetical protein
MSVIYLIMTFFAYFSTTDDTDPIFLLRDSAFSPDVPMFIGKLALVCLMIVSVAIGTHPTRTDLLSICFKEGEEVPAKYHIATTLGLVALALVIAITFPNFIAVLSILGGFSCVTIVYILPSALLVKFRLFPVKSAKLIGIVTFFTILSLLGLTSLVTTIIAEA